MTSPLLAGKCIHCNYQLQQLSALRCPECGTPFDPNDELTVNLGRELTPSARWALAPAGRIMLIVLLAAAMTGAWFARLPPPLEDRAPINGSLLIIVGGIWSCWPLIRRLVVRLNRWKVAWFVARRRTPLWPGIVAVLTGVGILFGVPRLLAFRISEPAMNRIAQQNIRLHKSAVKDQWLGLYHAHSIMFLPNEAIFTTTREEHVELGFVYCPNVDPKSATWNSRTYLADGWWTWRELR